MEHIPSNLNISHHRSTSLTLTSPVKTTRRNSILTSRRRKSIKLPVHLRHPLTTSSSRDDTTSSSLQPISVDAPRLAQLLARSEKGKEKQVDPPMLIIDLRPLNAYLGPNGRLRGSINLNFPSLLIKRFRKAAQLNLQLHSFITTDAGKRYYTLLEKTCLDSLGGSSNTIALSKLDLCVLDEQLNDGSFSKSSRSNSHTSSTGKILLDLLAKLFYQAGRNSGLYFLNERFRDAAGHSELKPWIVRGEHPEDQVPLLPLPTVGLDLDTPQAEALTAKPSSSSHQMSTRAPSPHGPRGLLRLRPCRPVRSLPCIDKELVVSKSPVLNVSTAASNNSDSPHSDGHTPLLPLSVNSSNLGSKPKPPKLRRIDTSESLLAPQRSGASSLRAKSSLSLIKTDTQSLNASPHHAYSNHSTSLVNDSCGSRLDQLGPATSSNPSLDSELTPSGASIPDHGASFCSFGADPSSESVCSISPAPTTHPEIAFKISTIIPSFLYLGPEPSKGSDFEELERLGIRRILNLAVECTDEEEEVFKEGGKLGFVEKYVQIPMRDFVEEVGVQGRIDEANLILDDASLHCAPIYVHCKAGKSRSVTVVLAYLIHRYGWSLRQAYTHVADRRKGICPNIGFLAELMNFEERELGNKSHGVVGGGGGLPAVRSVSHCYSNSFSSPGTAIEGSGPQAGPLSSGPTDFQGFTFSGGRRHGAGVRVRSVALGKQEVSGVMSRVRDSVPAGFGRSQEGFVNEGGGCEGRSET